MGRASVLGPVRHSKNRSAPTTRSRIRTSVQCVVPPATSASSCWHCTPASVTKTSRLNSRPAWKVMRSLEASATDVEAAVDVVAFVLTVQFPQAPILLLTCALLFSSSNESVQNVNSLVAAVANASSKVYLFLWLTRTTEWVTVCETVYNVRLV